MVDNTIWNLVWLVIAVVHLTPIVSWIWFGVELTDDERTVVLGVFGVFALAMALQKGVTFNLVWLAIGVVHLIPVLLWAWLKVNLVSNDRLIVFSILGIFSLIMMLLSYSI
jgi:hypothetical protein